MVAYTDKHQEQVRMRLTDAVFGRMVVEVRSLMDALPSELKVCVLVIAGEGKEQHPTVFLIRIVHPCRNELNLHLLGILVLADDASTIEVDRLFLLYGREEDTDCFFATWNHSQQF